MVRREKIGDDVRRYDARRPQPLFWLEGEVRIQPPDNLLRVTFPIRYELQNG